jgi:hypothetical protein
VHTGLNYNHLFDSVFFNAEFGIIFFCVGVRRTDACNGISVLVIVGFENKPSLLTYKFDAVLLGLSLIGLGLFINIPFFYLTRRSKTLLKFGVVGASGTIIDFIFYKLFIANSNE